MNSTGQYLYCIVRCSEERTFADVAPIGDPAGAVYTVPHNGLSAVVSDSGVTEYEPTRVNTLAHQRVQERILRDFTILPVRFGTVSDPMLPNQNMRRLLEKKFLEFEGLLADMEGKTELGLKALWRDEGAIFEEIVAGSPTIRRFRDSLRHKPPEVLRFEALPLGKMVKEAMEEKKSREATTVLAPLHRASCRVKENDILLDRMIVNAAFLVEREREGNFDQAVRELDREMGDRVIFKYVGPVPPYNFVNIVVNWEEL